MFNKRENNYNCNLVRRLTINVNVLWGKNYQVLVKGFTCLVLRNGNNFSSFSGPHTSFQIFRHTAKFAAQLNASQTIHWCSIYSVCLHSLLLNWQFLALLLIADLIWLCTFLFPFSKETCVFVYKKYLILRAAVLSLKLHRS